MADKVPKPRRTRGTVAYRSRNYFALGVLAVGGIYGLIFHYTGPAQTLLQSIYEGKFSPTEEELERKAMMSVVPRKRGETIKKLVEESQNPPSY